MSIPSRSISTLGQFQSSLNYFQFNSSYFQDCIVVGIFCWAGSTPYTLLSCALAAPHPSDGSSAPIPRHFRFWFPMRWFVDNITGQSLLLVIVYCFRLLFLKVQSEGLLVGDIFRGRGVGIFGKGSWKLVWWEIFLLPSENKLENASGN